MRHLVIHDHGRKHLLFKIIDRIDVLTDRADHTDRRGSKNCQRDQHFKQSKTAFTLHHFLPEPVDAECHFLARSLATAHRAPAL
ncbi:Uncharacterised protein [Vibrio cholerae]|nr:Uncharacterised protein [Vibrio cholerae]CSI27507.1 Uncharacterised protein [Vibrio cholerae]